MFYISSRGSSANNWVANVLNKHGKITCFTSSRSFPPIEPNKAYPKHSWVKYMPPKKYIESLLICEESCRGLLNFGSIHGYHGTVIKKDCENNGGVFSYITREPLERIHSVFIADLWHGIYKDYKKIDNENIFQHVISLFDDTEISKNYLDGNSPNNNLEFLKSFSKFYKLIPKNNLIYKNIKNLVLKMKNKNDYENSSKSFDEKEYIIKYFDAMCRNFFEKELDLFRNCKNEVQGLKMEELVKSKEYFQNKLLNKIEKDEDANNLLMSQLSFDKIDRVGVHRKNPIKAEEIWKNLPKCLKEIYLYNFKKYNISEMCNFFDYNVSYME